jgi:hypothetical protein
MIRRRSLSALSSPLEVEFLLVKQRNFVKNTSVSLVELTLDFF